MNVKEFFLSERELKNTLRDSLTRAAWFGPSNFLLVRSEHAHASYPGLPGPFFRPPGFSPFKGREERRVQGLDYVRRRRRQWISDPKRADSWSSSASKLLQCVHLMNAENVEATRCRPYRISENCRVNWFLAHASYPGLPGPFFRPPGFSPFKGREERRVQGLDYVRRRRRQWISDPKRADSWSSSASKLLQCVHLVNAENVEATRCRPYRISENCRVNWFL